MSDFERTEQTEFQFSKTPDFNQLLGGLMGGKPTEAVPKANGFDPHKLMVKKNQIERGEIAASTSEPAPVWPVEDVKALEDYCRKFGIIGFSTRHNPKLALMQLKKQMGDMSDIPLENRVPTGYEKRGTLNSNSCNYPFSKPPAKKSLLNG